MSVNGIERPCRRCGKHLRINHSRDQWYCRECVKEARRPALTMQGFVAACHDPQHDPEWWWPENPSDSCIPVAVAICFQCPVVNKCLEYAITAQEREGIWGGTTPRERAEIIAARRKAG